jgi:hypothetical protein
MCLGIEIGIERALQASSPCERDEAGNTSRWTTSGGRR